MNTKWIVIILAWVLLVLAIYWANLYGSGWPVVVIWGLGCIGATVLRLTGRW